MDKITQLPELEACGWFVRVKRTPEDPAGQLIADCSATTEGAKYALQFAAAPDMAQALQMALDGIPAIQSNIRIVMEMALVKAGYLTIEPRFSSTSCSQCGADLGPGDAGVSSCADHAQVRHVRICGEGL